MLINVSTLLQEPVGSARDYEVESELATVAPERYEQVVSGRVHLIRSERGVLVQAHLSGRRSLQCDRCLADFTAPFSVDFDEEYVDHVTVGGEATRPDPDEFRVDERRHLDLSEAVRQYEQSALPLHPLCREDCAGLCPTCGQDWNAERCACATVRVDRRWAALQALADRLQGEEPDGSPEA